MIGRRGAIRVTRDVPNNEAKMSQEATQQSALRQHHDVDQGNVFLVISILRI